MNKFKVLVFIIQFFSLFTNGQDSSIITFSAKMKGTITDVDSKKPVEAIIIVKKLNSNFIQKINNNSENGSYLITMEPGFKYSVEISKKGYSTYKREFNLINLNENKQFLDNINLFKDVNLKITTIDTEYSFPVTSNIQITETESGSIIYKSENTKNNNQYIIQLPIGKLYKVNILAKNYNSKSYSLDLRKNVIYRELYKETELSPIKQAVNIKLSDSEAGIGMNLDLLITNLETEEEFTTSASVGRDGKYALNLREGNKYNIQVKTPNGYAFSNTKVTIKSANGTYDVDINLIALKVGAKLLLKDIYFEYNSPELYEDSFEELLRVINLMKEYPNMVIEIDAHTDDIGNEQFNQKLSEKRAHYVAHFISNREILQSRLQTKGFGESLPLLPNDSESNRMKNRRLELKVIKI